MGLVRRHLLSCAVAGADGSVREWGRAVMKNVAGYDIPRLLCGSRGRLGVLLRATFRVWALPGADRSCRVEGIGDPLSAAGRLVGLSPEDHPRPDGLCWRWSPGSGEDGRLEARFLGSEPSVAARLARMRRWISSEGGEFRSTEPGREPAGGAGQSARAEAGAPLPARTRPAGLARLRLHPGRSAVTDLARSLRGVLEHADARTVPARCLEAHPLLGWIRLTAPQPREGVGATLTALLAAARGCSVAVEAGGPALRRAVRERRPEAIRSLEASVATAAGGGSPVHWRAEYL